MKARKFVSLLLAGVLCISMSVPAFADDGFTGDSMSGNATKQYQIVENKTYTDVSAVKLTWNVPVMTFTINNGRTWNVNTLCWETETSTSLEGDLATFTLQNRGSKAVIGTAAFTLDSAFTTGAVTAAFTGNDVSIPSIVDTDHSLKASSNKEDYLTSNCTKTITATLSVDRLPTVEIETTLGIYTVSIAYPSVSVTCTASIAYDSNYENEKGKLTATLTGAAATGYQWYREESKIDGATSQTLTNVNDGKTYKCVITYAGGSAEATFQTGE